MANQIVVSAGAKVRNLDGVLTGTSGVVNSLPINASNGIPQLDVNGKILVSQLPNSVMEYKGTWNVSTNTPTLVNGVGNQGDVYLVEGAAVGGTAFNFGAGPITFFNGDQVIYSGSIWQRASGATGTVTSVAVTESGDSLNITGSPITTSGTINIGFNGTNLQYVNGAGNLTTFPTLMTSVGLTMPSAFTVTNSPLTGAGGTLAVTGAGTTAQYIRGDGSLATFPTIASEAQRLITEVYNSTGATLTKGTVVYINGGQGNLPTVTKAIATGDATSAQTYGIVQTDITNMNNGYVVVVGSLMDLDTQAYAAGTQLYLSSTTAGAWTSVKQYAPAHLVYVGIVVRSHPTQGVVEVRIQNGFEMDELHNVSAQSPSNNQGLFYNTSTSLWENKSIATALGYTPADDSLVVHLTGNETIGGDKTFTGTTTSIASTYFNLDGALGSGTCLNIKQYSSSTAMGVGYSSIGAYNTTKFTFLLGNTTAFNSRSFYLDAASLTVNTPRNYILPDASGTISLTSDLAGYVDLTTAQTIGGTKTFSDATKNNGGIFLQNASSNSLAGYMNIGGLTNGVKFTSGGGISNTFTLPSSTGYTFTFPNATGTLALTTDLSAYLPLAGGTLTGPLNGTSASFSGLIQSTSTGLNASVRITNTTATTGRDWHLYSLNNGNFGLYNNTDGAYAYQITPSGNLGLGVTPSASTIQHLEFGSNAIITSANSSYLLGNAVFNSGWKYITSSVQATQYQQTNGSHIWYNAPSGTAGAAITFTQAMTLDASGNLGIGETSPSSFGKLAVYGGAANTIVSIKTNSFEGTYYAALNFSTGGQGANDPQAQIRVVGENNYSASIRFLTQTSGTVNPLVEKMRLFSDGNLLLQSGGTFTNAGYKLDVNGTGRFSSQLFVNYSGSSDTLVVTSSGSANGIGLRNRTGDDYAFFNWRNNSGTELLAEQYLQRTAANTAVMRYTIANGSASPATYLTIESTGAATFTSSVTATSFFESSDSRLKTLIQDNYQTKGIASITPKLYTKNGKVELGYYAQDFVGILDSAVSKGSDDMLSLSYREVLVAKVYALEQRIKELESKMN